MVLEFHVVLGVTSEWPALLTSHLKEPQEILRSLLAPLVEAFGGLRAGLAR